MLLSAEQISKNYGGRTLLDRVSLYLDRGEKIGVVGVNGAGKSTLLKMLAGAEEPETGHVTRDPHVRLEYLAQNPSFEGDATVIEQVFLRSSPQARELAEYEAKTILTRLGITRFDQPVRELSGGQRKRVAMASALVHPCDVLILDEPTNHLDDGMVRWLEDHLRRYHGALVMVTHDRYFLERVTNQIAEVENGALYLYEGNFTRYLELKTQRLEMAAASERKRQSILRREYQWVTQGAKARGTKSRDRLERYEALKEKEGSQEEAGLSLSAMTSRLGKKTVELRGVSKSFGSRTVIRRFDCMLQRDDRVGIVGANGSGKTTLLNLIAGRCAPDEGDVILGETVRIGYFCQENPKMDPKQRVIDYVREIGERIETPEGTLTAAQLLEKFLFPGETQWSPVSRLSGGEKRRLFLLCILAQAPNILLLDEPTNDLDIQTLAILEDYLDTFPGAVIAVSHDRFFLERVTRRVYAVEEGGVVTACPGGYDEYLSVLASRRIEKTSPSPSPSSRARAERSDTPKKLKFTYKQQREYETIDGEIAALEAEISAVKREQEEKAADYLALAALQARQEELEESLSDKMERWVFLSELAEKINLQQSPDA